MTNWFLSSLLGSSGDTTSGAKDHPRITSEEPVASLPENPTTKKKRVAVIGAGASGLVAIKECVQAGLDVVCYEQEPHISGLWHYVPPHSSSKEPHSVVYDSTVVNTSKSMMGYSDFLVPKEWPTFLPHKLVDEYLDMYCNHFQLKRYIKFNRKVLSVTPKKMPDGTHTGSWLLSYQRIRRKGSTTTTSPTDDTKTIASNETRSKTIEFDFVIVCTGHHSKPRLPDFPGMETFTGTMIHSHRYRVPYPFKDQKVLVVGAGNSGMDIATELSHHASQVYLSTRSGTWILPRSTLFGIPVDNLSSRAAHYIPRSLMNLALQSLTRLHHGDSLEKYGLRPRHDLLQAHPTINSEILGRIDAGKVSVVPNIRAFKEGNIVVFEDGTEFEADAIIYCTGYKIETSFLDPEVLGQTTLKSQDEQETATISSASISRETDRISDFENQVRLYKHIFPLNFRNIAFVGLVQPLGSIMPVAEMQSRWISAVFSGSCKPLPPPKAMRDEIDKDWMALCQTYIPRERHTINVDFVTYMDEIAASVGCLPDLWTLWKTKARLAFVMTFGPAFPQHYRLQGPGSWPEAENVILSSLPAFQLSST